MKINKQCPICGKDLGSVVYPDITKKETCSSACAELSSEIHQIETQLRRLKVKASDRAAVSKLQDRLQKVLDMFEMKDADGIIYHEIPNSFQTLKKIDDALWEMYEPDIQ